MEEGGEGTKGTAWAGGRGGRTAVGMLEMLAVGKTEGSGVSVAAGSVWDGR